MALLCLVNGFLGSGKTTAIRSAATGLHAHEQRVSIITNDQGAVQVDFGWLQQTGLPAEQVSNGCFCCQLDSLVQAIQDQLATNPDVIFAEAVGSCTDVIATVAKPLALQFPDFHIVVTTVIDAVLASAVLEGKASFLNEDVRYIFRKQLEEADVMLISKTDLINAEALARLTGTLATEYPATLIITTADQAYPTRQWVAACEGLFVGSRQSLTIDYDQYAAGEAALAWYDARLRLSGSDVTARLVELIEQLTASLTITPECPGHLKFYAWNGSHGYKISCTATQHDDAKLLLKDPSEEWQLTINLRVQSDPESVVAKVEALINRKRSAEVAVNMLSSAHFTPGYPRPTQRIA